MPAVVEASLCEACEDCIDVCPVEAITMEDDHAVVEPDDCTECQACVDPCPSDAISMLEDDD